MKRLTHMGEHGPYWDKAVFDKLGGMEEDVIIDRLAAYEETGLDPEELKSLIPVPIGTPVYVGVPCVCHPTYAKRCQERQANPDKRWKACTIIRMDADRTGSNCAKIYERPFAISHIGKVGKTVFLTIEDAVASLKKEG